MTEISTERMSETGRQRRTHIQKKRDREFCWLPARTGRDLPDEQPQFLKSCLSEESGASHPLLTPASNRRFPITDTGPY